MWLPNSDQQLRNRREMNFFIYMAMISNFLISKKQEQRKFIRGQNFPHDEHAALYV
jgi:hypothetical protein